MELMSWKYFEDMRRRYDYEAGDVNHFGFEDIEKPAPGFCLSIRSRVDVICLSVRLRSLIREKRPLYPDGKVYKNQQLRLKSCWKQ